MFDFLGRPGDMPESPGKPSFTKADRLHVRMNWGLVAVIWAGGVITVLVVWVLLANGKPVDWAAAVGTALGGPTAGIIPLAWQMRARYDRLGPDDNFLEP
jgi:hypothetical protein